jgi:hypothetical protein
MKNNTYLDYQNIILTHANSIKADPASIEWGKKVLLNLNLEQMTDFKKASIIQDYLSKNFKSTIKSRLSLAEMIKHKGGNCISHAIIGIFLLRLAQIPAKLAREIHLMRQYTVVSIFVGAQGKKNNYGLNSYWHNEHFWVWFENNGRWEPFDSDMELCGFDEFYDRRLFHQKDGSTNLMIQWTGPPFVIWEETTDGCDRMVNITPQIWNDASLKMYHDKTGWLRFINVFDKWTANDFLNGYLPDNELNEVKAASRKWFSKNKKRSVAGAL